MTSHHTQPNLQAKTVSNCVQGAKKTTLLVQVGFHIKTRLTGLITTNSHRNDRQSPGSSIAIVLIRRDLRANADDEYDLAIAISCDQKSVIRSRTQCINTGFVLKTPNSSARFETVDGTTSRTSIQQV